MQRDESDYGQLRRELREMLAWEWKLDGITTVVDRRALWRSGGLDLGLFRDASRCCTICGQGPMKEDLIVEVSRNEWL